jgi:hypothetical protein
MGVALRLATVFFWVSCMLLFLSRLCKLPAACVRVTCVDCRRRSLPALDRLTRTSEARAVLLVVLIMCILSHPGKARLLRHVLASAHHRHGAGHAAFALLGSRIAAGREGWAAQSIVQATKSALTLGSHLVVGVSWTHGDHAGVIGVEVGGIADGLERRLIVTWGGQVLEHHLAWRAEIV